jgi:hypothetical protein
MTLPSPDSFPPTPFSGDGGGEHALGGVRRGNVVATGEVALAQHITVEVIDQRETAAGEKVLSLGGGQEGHERLTSLHRQTPQ